MKPSEASKKLEFHSKQICHGCVHPSMVGWCENHCQLPEALEMAISALKWQEENRWVPVTERFPNDDCECRVTTEGKYYKWVGTCFWNKYTKCFEEWNEYQDCMVPLSGVTAWKPIEEPYIAEEDDGTD